MKNILKASALAIMLALVIPGILNAQSGNTDFSGTWVFNAEKSNLGGGGGMGGGRGFGAGDMTVSQSGNVLTVSTTRPGRDGGQVNTTMKYTLDGKESVNAFGRGDSKSTASWSGDGKSLTIKTSRTMDMGGESRTMNTTDTWTLNGNTLNVAATMTTPNGDRTTTRVYDKK